MLLSTSSQHNCQAQLPAVVGFPVQGTRLISCSRLITLWLHFSYNHSAQLNCIMMCVWDLLTRLRLVKTLATTSNTRT